MSFNPLNCIPGMGKCKQNPEHVSVSNWVNDYVMNCRLRLTYNWLSQPIWRVYVIGRWHDMTRDELQSYFVTRSCASGRWYQQWAGDRFPEFDSATDHEGRGVLIDNVHYIYYSPNAMYKWNILLTVSLFLESPSSPAVHDACIRVCSSYLPLLISLSQTYVNRWHFL